MIQIFYIESFITAIFIFMKIKAKKTSRNGNPTGEKCTKNTHTNRKKTICILFFQRILFPMCRIPMILSYSNIGVEKKCGEEMKKRKRNNKNMQHSISTLTCIMTIGHNTLASHFLSY